MRKAIHLKKELRKSADPEKAEILQRFFKTGKGEYGYGDIFWGITVPQQRKITAKYKSLCLTEIVKLLKDRIHECRFCALLLLVVKYENGDEKAKKEVLKKYLKNIKYVNNWDLIDLSAPKILGSFYLKRNRKKIKELAGSRNLWERRAAIVATSTFIRNKDIDFTFEISKKFLNDKHDLIHKATGWMLRETGKIDEKALKNFLSAHTEKMPRIMLRYAIEKFKESERKRFLKSGANLQCNK